MKKSFTILVLIQSLLSFSQTYYPLFTTNAPNGSYIKDTNNEFNPYIGTWEGTWDNKKITFYLTKLEHQRIEYLSDNYEFRDFVIAKYRVMELSTGAIIEDNTNITDFKSIDLRAMVINRAKNFLRLTYRGGFSRCGLLADVIIYKDLMNPDQLNYKFYITDGLESFWDGHCNYTSLDQIPVPIPKVALVLHRQ